MTQNKTRLTKTKKVNIWDLAFYVIYALALFYETIDTTMIELPIPYVVGLARYGLLLVYAAGKLILMRKSYLPSQWIFSVVLLVVFAIPAVTTDYSYLLEMGLLIVCAKDIDFDAILAIYFIETSVVMLLAMLLSAAGVIPNLQYHVWDRGVRNSFGAIYPTDFCAHLFFLAVAWLIASERMELEKKNLVLAASRIILPIAFAALSYFGCYGYTSTACLILLALFAALHEVLRFRRGKTIFMYLSLLLPGIFTYAFYKCVIAAVCLKPWALSLNDKMSGRLLYTATALGQYKIKLFGQNLFEVGLGRDEATPLNYFFIDNSYFRMLLLYGAVTFVAILLIWIIIGAKAIKRGRFMVVIALIAVSVHCIMEHHILDVAYNPLFMLLFARFPAKRES